MMQDLPAVWTVTARSSSFFTAISLPIPSIVEKVKGSGKLAFVHMDLIQGLSSKEAAVDYISKFTKADGIISTKAP